MSSDKIKRRVWQCPGCERRFTIPANDADPAECPNCRKIREGNSGHPVEDPQRGLQQDRAVTSHPRITGVAAHSFGIALLVLGIISLFIYWLWSIDIALIAFGGLGLLLGSIGFVFVIIACRKGTVFSYSIVGITLRVIALIIVSVIALIAGALIWVFTTIEFIKGEYNKTIEDHNQAIRLDPNDASAYFWRGWAYEQKGDQQKAKADFNKAESLGGNLIDYFRED